MMPGPSDPKPSDPKPPGPKPLAALWRTLTKIDKSKINSWMALRNALAVAIPLSVGIAIHHGLAGVAVATGALNVSYSDGRDPYAQRARRMLGWTLLSAVAVFIGSATGRYTWLAVLAAAAWAFLAGMLVSVSTRMGDLGLNTLVTLLVYAARGALSLEGAAGAAALVTLGGLIQTAAALVFWPIRRSEPERLAIAETYRKLASEINPAASDPLTTALGPISQQTQDVLDALGMDHSLASERYKMLFDQADRLRMSVFALDRLRPALENNETALKTIDSVRAETAKIAQGIADCLSSDSCPVYRSTLLQQVYNLLEQHPFDGQKGLLKELAEGVETLAGQLRTVIRLASHAGVDGAAEFAREEREHPWRLHVSSWLGSMRANLNRQSAFFRHAIRLSVCVAIGDAIGRTISWQRTYWIPMTIAVVLKPDFTTTISRGVLRLAGTYFGLAVATALYHLLPQSAVSQLFLVGAFTLLLRSLGPANYGIFTTAVSGLIVFLVAETGIAPAQVVAERAVNTAAGGIFALVAYGIWPTWEREHVSVVLARLLGAIRNYFQGVAVHFGSGEPLLDSALDTYRSEYRAARSAAEASVDRLACEPGTKPEQVRCVASILAAATALVYCIMGLEAEVLKQHSSTTPGAFKTFAHDVDLTLYFLIEALRGSKPAIAGFPKLREDHTRMVKARDRFSPLDELILMETDRLTVALNTLREQVSRYVGL